MSEENVWNEYRCTRNSSSCPNPKGRNGHYIEARDKEGAISRMRLKFPNEVDKGFTCDLWKSNIKHYSVTENEQ
jgi:hypothetical protein